MMQNALNVKQVSYRMLPIENNVRSVYSFFKWVHRINTLNSDL